jgi:N6-adenosine-specific RNA methylase IME4
MEAGPYEVLLMDPPWYYYGDPNKMAAAGKHYSLMPDVDIAALPVPELLDKRGIVFMWTTSSTLKRGMDLLATWGLEYRGVAFDWIKTGKTGKPFGARGVRPSIVKPITEQVICGSRVGKGRPLPLSDESVQQTIFATVGHHSAKPAEVHAALTRMYPATRKLEMFAREHKPGWVCWGNQAESEA